MQNFFEGNKDAYNWFSAYMYYTVYTVEPLIKDTLSNEDASLIKTPWKVPS